MTTEQEYKDAVAAKERAQTTINEFHRQQDDSANARWERFDKNHEAYTDEELIYSATSRCEKCKSGLAYPKNCPSNARQWTCSSVLKNIGTDKGHGAYPFSFYEIKSENQPSAQGQTTRPKNP